MADFVLRSVTILLLRLTGVAMASRTVQPFAILALINPRDIPVIRDHSLSVCDLPSSSMMRLDRVLFAWSTVVAHRQFSGPYPSSLLMRSSECILDGLAPMSE